MPFREATPEERKLYYLEEWSAESMPEYITSSLKNREFAFDYNGEGPKDRYRSFISLTQLEGQILAGRPYAAYSSVSLYGEPENRRGWLSAELVFDIDAKDLPARSCECGEGEVCELCLEQAKEYVLEFSDTLRESFYLEDINYVYSGRGYHIRVFDEEVMGLGSQERAELLDYIAGNVVPDNLNRSYGYAQVFKRRVAKNLPHLSAKQLEEFGIGKKKARRLIYELPDILPSLEGGSLREIKELMKTKKAYTAFLEGMAKLNAETLDAKVTVDIKRILRLPTSLHSKVSMVCTPVRDIESFDPLKQALPKFVREKE